MVDKTEVPNMSFLIVAREKKMKSVCSFKFNKSLNSTYVHSLDAKLGGNEMPKMWWSDSSWSR